MTVRSVVVLAFFCGWVRKTCDVDGLERPLSREDIEQGESLRTGRGDGLGFISSGFGFIFSGVGFISGGVGLGSVALQQFLSNVEGLVSLGFVRFELLFLVMAERN